MLRLPVRLGALVVVIAACNQASSTPPSPPDPAAPAAHPAAGHVPAAHAAAGRDSVVYRLSPVSRLEVRTGKAGLFGFAGHEHTIRAREFAGTVVYFPDAPLRSHVLIRIATDSLEVMTPPDTAEIRKVTEAMRTEVLHVNRYGEMLFQSTSGPMTAIEGGFRMIATLTMHGQAHQVPVDLRVAIGRDTIRAGATFSVNQTDYGIRPFRGGPGGTVRVADRVTFQIEAVAVRREN
jgi:polyisoprenoid-binding protein YceI